MDREERRQSCLGKGVEAKSNMRDRRKRLMDEMVFKSTLMILDSGWANGLCSDFVSNHLDFDSSKKPRFEKYIQCIKTPENQLKAAKKLTSLLYKEPRLGSYVTPEIMDLLITFLDCENRQLQIYAASIIGYAILPPNEGSVVFLSDKTKTIASLAKLTYLPNVVLVREALFALTSIAYVFPDTTRAILSSGILDVVKKIAIYDYDEFYSLWRCATFLAVICNRKQQIPSDKEEYILEIGKVLVKYHYYRRLLPQACYILACLCDGRHVDIGTTTTKCVMMYMGHADNLVAISALELIGNLVRWGKDRQIEFMIKKGVLKRLRSLMISHKGSKKVLNEVCRIIQNIACRSKTLIQDLDKASMIKRLCNILKDESDIEIQMAAVWAIRTSLHLDNSQTKGSGCYSWYNVTV